MPENFKTKLTNYLDAGYTMLSVETHEELRVVSEIRSVAAVRTYRDADEDGKETGRAKPVVYGEWDAIATLELMKLGPTGDVTDSSKVNDSRDLVKALAQLLNQEGRGIYVLKDLHHYIDKDVLLRMLRNMLNPLKNRGSTLILVSPRPKIPPELAKDVQQIEYALPSREELKTLFNNFLENSVRVKPDYRRIEVEENYPDAVAEAAMGMTEMEADAAFGLAYVAIVRANGKLTFNGEFVRRVFEEKIASLKNTALEYMPSATGFEQIGGMDNLKTWSMQRRLGFEEEARKRKLPYPKGVLLAGIKGTGKTVTAMAIAKEFGFPLFKLDVGRLFASRVGESEGLARDLIKILDGIGRAVVLIDEIEKSFNTGSTSGSGDSGVSSRMFGTLISWMALKKSPVFIVGTLNNHENIPPELLRKGRFDEIWWVDLPTEQERVSIFNALLQHRYTPAKWSGEISRDILEKTRDFTGAEIEAAIQEALYASLSSDKSFDDLLLEACTGIIPQAQLDPAGLDAMRERAKAFKSASSSATGQPPALPTAAVRRGKRQLANA